jgi:predicted dehydrogenase
MTDRIAVRTVLDGEAHDYARMARPLIESLDPKRFEVAPSRPAVVLAASDRTLDPDEAERLREFVRGGGGLVLLHGTLAAWAASDSVRELAGWVPGGTSRSTELVVHTVPGHPLTRGLGPEWAVADEIFLSEGPPVDASILLRTVWRFTEQVVGYERRYGDGRFVYLGLGHEASTYSDPTFQRLVARMLMFAAGTPVAEPAGVGLIGYGAIARDHASAIAATDGLKLAAVCDLSEQRREAAAREWSIPTYARQEELLDDPEVGLVIVGTPPVAHAGSVLTALSAGKHVVCEKPFALHVEEADRMIDAAAVRGLALTVYQSRRWDPDYLAVRSAVSSGRIGELFYMESFIGGYGHPCDFWHSHEPISGGMIYDWGSHYFDWILQLFGDRVTSLAARAHKLVWHDVTNADQVRVDLSFSSGAQATFLQSDIAAVRKPKWYVLGTRGAIVADWVAEPVPADFPARVTVHRPAQHGTDAEALSLGPRDDRGFYRNLSSHLAWGERLAVLPEEARRNVAVMEAATRSIARGGQTIQVEI